MPMMDSRVEKIADNRPKAQNQNLVWLLETHPSLYFRLLNGINGAISTGNLSLEDSIDPRVSSFVEIRNSSPTRSFPTLLEAPNSSQTILKQNHADTGGVAAINESLFNEQFGDDLSKLDSLELEEFSTGIDWPNETLSTPSADDTSASWALQAAACAENYPSSLSLLLQEDCNGDDERQRKACLTDALWCDIAQFGE